MRSSSWSACTTLCNDSLEIIVTLVLLLCWSTMTEMWNHLDIVVPLSHHPPAICCHHFLLQQLFLSYLKVNWCK